MGCEGKNPREAKAVFFDDYVCALLAEAKKLEISPDEVIRMITEGAAK